LRKWQKGDLVGAGEVYLPDTKSKKEYASECRRMMIESAAQHVSKMRTIEERRQFISKQPINRQKDLKNRIREIWRK
jgi:hypothetical protein